MSYRSHLECGLCAKELEPDRLWNLCPACDRPLLARYDLDAARLNLNKETFGARGDTLWRRRELLPVRDPNHVLSLGEGWTPLFHAVPLGREIGHERLYKKDEGLNPTASFKARGLGVPCPARASLGSVRSQFPRRGMLRGP